MLVFVIVAAFVAFLIAHALVLDEVINQINDAHAGPYVSPFGATSRWDPYWKNVFKRHRELFPNSRLRLWSNALNAALIAFVAAFVVFYFAGNRSQVETDHGQAAVQSAS